jgi:hypothetical protein
MVMAPEIGMFYLMESAAIIILFARLVHFQGVVKKSTLIAANISHTLCSTHLKVNLNIF